MNDEIREGQVRLSLEGFGGKSLVTVVERKDVEGKSFRQVINDMSSRPYSGREQAALTAIQTQMSSSDGYRAKVGVGYPNRLEPVGLDDKVAPYIQKAPGLGEGEVLRTTVLGKHVLG